MWEPDKGQERKRGQRNKGREPRRIKRKGLAVFLFIRLLIRVPPIPAKPVL